MKQKLLILLVFVLVLSTCGVAAEPTPYTYYMVTHTANIRNVNGTLYGSVEADLSQYVDEVICDFVLQKLYGGGWVTVAGTSGRFTYKPGESFYEGISFPGKTEAGWTYRIKSTTSARLGTIKDVDTTYSELETM